MQILEDVRDLLDSGMRLLDPGLLDPGLNDERSIPRLVEVWSALFGNVLPYFEAVFLPLQRELREEGELVEIVGRGWDVRRLVLMGFRDFVVLPLFSRLRGRLSFPGIRVFDVLLMMVINSVIQHSNARPLDGAERCNT